MPNVVRGSNRVDISAAKQRCLEFRKRILDLSQKSTAMHIAPAFSCLEILDTVYFSLMRRRPDGETDDTFLLSKGHGCMSLYVILERLGQLASQQLEEYCTPNSQLGGHPDYGTPGVTASTGSLGHGLGMAVGMAYADKLKGDDRTVFVLIGDGEMQEGSIWEALMMAPNLGLNNLVVFLDLNDFQGLGRTSEIHPSFYPVAEKVAAFGWEVAEVDGHDHLEMIGRFDERKAKQPLFIIARTVKGKGVSYMENVPIWHYRSPNPAEYRQALAELAEAV